MKKIVFLLLFTCSMYAQEAFVIHINAGWNSSNDWYGLESISGARVFGGDIEKKPGIKEKYNITKVPTLILFRDGEEIERWEGGLDMKLHVSVSEVQQSIDRK